MSHGRFGLPPTGDTARAYGSLKDYYKEVSNNNLLLVPGQTGVNKTGIVNNIVTDGFGTRYVEPIKMNYPKLSHYHVPDNSSLVEQIGMQNMLDDAKMKLQEMYNLGQIEFNLSAFNGKILYVFAGGTRWIGGLVAPPFDPPFYVDNSAIFREKLTENAYLSSTDPLLKYSVINGIAITCHEFGHLLGWRHTAHGNYDLMNGNGKENQNCPSHVNIVYKIQAGWIDDSKIRKVRTISEVQNLPPVEAGGDCAVITVYGKPGHANNWEHSEYYVVENRRMFEREDLSVKFDKKLVWRRDLVPPTPNGFNGGCLVTHFIQYNPLDVPLIGNNKLEVKLVNALSTRDWNLVYDPGDSRDFFGVQTSDPNTPVISQLITSRTNSSFNIPTGIALSNISGNANYTLNFQTNYTIEEPPDYSFVNDGNNLPGTLNLSGFVFMNVNQFKNKEIIVSPGTTFDFVNQNMAVVGNSNIDANGTSQNPINFRGIGYGTNRLNFLGLIIGVRPLISSSGLPTRLKYCNFNNLNSPNLGYSIIVATTLPTNIPLILENNTSSPAKDIRIYPTNENLTIENIAYNQMDIHLRAETGKITTAGTIHVPQGRTVYFEPYSNGAYYLFNDNTFLDIEGRMVAEGSSSGMIIFDKTAGSWGSYYMNVWGGASLKYCDIKNSGNGLNVTYPSSSVLVENCLFENNHGYDLTINGFLNPRITAPVVKNNVFNVSRFQAASLVAYNGANIEISNNTFNNVYGTGIYASYVNNALLKENVIYASVQPGINPVAGILQYTTGGNINCNYATNFFNGIILDNSSPKVFNNTITNNSVGLYLTNGSQPQLAPTFIASETLLDGGYNRFYNNLYEEIKCNNEGGGSELPMSLPIMDNGYNTVYHEGLSDCMFNTGIELPSDYLITNNYWGVNGPDGRICPSMANIIYEPYLTEEPASVSCNPVIIAGDNSAMQQGTLLLGSANIDLYNGNLAAAEQKYKQLISSFSNSWQTYLPVSLLFHASARDSAVDLMSLESYYSSLSSQYQGLLGNRSASFSTSADVLQPSYQEAIDEYQTVINTTQNQAERQYAIIDQLRTFRLMLDSLISIYEEGDNQGASINNMCNSLIRNALSNELNASQFRPNQQSYKHSEYKDKSNVYAGNVSSILSDLKRSLGIDNVATENISLEQKINLIGKIIAYKIHENYILVLPNGRPLNRIFATDNFQKQQVVNIPKRFALHQNYPNPFNPVTKIKYDIPKDEMITFKVFDILGREVFSMSEFRKAGSYETVFDGSLLASGVYFYSLDANEFKQTKKMLLLK